MDGGRLAGLAWLEGDGERSLAVRAAVWNGRRWQAPQPVSVPARKPARPHRAVLADGSWLLAWSAFDGTADEIVWSRRQGRQWLPVKRVSAPNAVPDITPALTATAKDGALLAWSRFDGEGYQLRMARFEGGEWRGERPAGSSGSLYPTFLGGADSPRLLYLDADPRAWTFTLDSEGRVKAKASVSAARLDRPAVVLGNGEVRMRWPSLAREETARSEKVPSFASGSPLRSSFWAWSPPLPRRRPLRSGSLPLATASRKAAATILSEPQQGYPPRLEALLQAAGVSATVLNFGEGGERTPASSAASTRC